jgi:hypothetical protein
VKGEPKVACNYKIDIVSGDDLETNFLAVVQADTNHQFNAVCENLYHHLNLLYQLSFMSSIAAFAQVLTV